MKNEYFKVWTTPFTISCLISHDYVFMLLLIGLWVAGIAFFFHSISSHLTIIEKYKTTPEDYFRAILILDFPDQGTRSQASIQSHTVWLIRYRNMLSFDLETGKMNELFMEILTSKLQLYKINEAYVNDPDSIQVSGFKKQYFMKFLVLVWFHDSLWKVFMDVKYFWTP